MAIHRNISINILTSTGLPAPDFRALFESASGLCLVLTPI
jgi:hypothetical protein